jgi:predicted O-methyltransferase YrrM
MSKSTRPELPYGSFEDISNQDSVEHSPSISQEQLRFAKIFTNREEYARSFRKDIRYLEVGVAWGYSAEMFIRGTHAVSADLIDLYNQDLKCWSWRKFGSCQCDGFTHELLYTPETHEQYIKDLFSWHSSINTIRGNALDILPTLNKEYDLVYIDISNNRIQTREALKSASNLVPPGGIIGMNDYLIYDGIIEDEAYGTFQTVNEFLHLNRNWVVDALALHPMGFYDIYLRRLY